MNILVIGNGFDLAHNLPTKYGDFLDFIALLGEKHIKDYTNYTGEKMKRLLTDGGREKMNNFINKLDNIDDIKKKIHSILDFKSVPIDGHSRSNIFKCNNFWIGHFFKRRNEIGENWIDFEQEISNVLEKLEYREDSFFEIFIEIVIEIVKEFYGCPKDYYCLLDKDYDCPKRDCILKDLRDMKKKSNEYIGIYAEGKIYINNTSYKDNESNIGKNDFLKWKEIYNESICTIVKKLQKDLDNLILVFELYLKEVVQTILVENRNTNIDNIGQIDKVISFNYTNTFSKIYDNNVEINYLHGNVREDLDKGINNIVLGTDEYLPKETKSTNLTFVYFKKYFQRIYKKLGAKYKEWLNTTQTYSGDEAEGIDYRDGKNKMAYDNVYFFGHSLATSDRDILGEIIESKYTKVKIFYYDIKSYGEQIQNLIKLIGQDKLLEYTYSENKKIEFIEQK